MYSESTARHRPQYAMVPEAIYLNYLKYFPLLTVDIVMVNNGKALLIRRSDHNSTGKGWWATVGGRVLKFESLYQAAKRVVKREIGQTYPMKAFGLRGFQESFANNTHALTAVFRVLTATSKVKLDETSSDYKWFSKDELGEMKPKLKGDYPRILRLAGMLE